MTIERLIRIALWSVLLTVVTYTRTDPDLWGHVRFGLDFLRDLRIPQVDPYSFTSDREWVNHEWAAEALTAGAFQVGGNAGLILLKVGVVGSILLLLYATLRRGGGRNVAAYDVVAGLAVLTTMPQAHHVRPQLFSLVLFAGMLSCLIQATTDGRRSRLFMLPPLFGLWANVHGGWILGGAVLVIWTVVVAFDRGVRSAVPLTLAGATSLAATLATPYGFELWRFLGETVGFGRADIREWQPVYVLDPHLWVLWGATFALAIVGVLELRRTRIHLERVTVAAILAVASLQVSRLLGFFALATLFLLGSAIATALGRRLERFPPEERRRPADRGEARLKPETTCAGPRLIAGAAIGVIALSLPVVALNVWQVRIDARHTPEAEALEFLRARGDSRVLVWFDWGQYAIWHLAPNTLVSVDGRRETLYSASVRDRHLRFYFDAPGGVALPTQLGADHVWIPRWLPAARRLQADDEWVRLYEGEQSVIFGRTEATPTMRLVARTDRARPRYFPGP